MSLAVYKFFCDFGRCGEIESIFIAEKDVANRLFHLKSNLYLGEVLGKHSDVELTPYDVRNGLEMLTDQPEEVELIRRLGCTSGRNLAEFLTEEDEESEDSEEDGESEDET